jgi:hypothetical protein
MKQARSLSLQREPKVASYSTEHFIIEHIQSLRKSPRRHVRMLIETPTQFPTLTGKGIVIIINYTSRNGGVQERSIAPCILETRRRNAVQ